VVPGSFHAFIQKPHFSIDEFQSSMEK